MNTMNSIPNWNVIQERQEEAQEEEDSHVLLSMSDYRMRELLWENGQPSELGFGEMSHPRSSGFNNSSMSDTSRDDTLEYIVDQATKNGGHHHHHHHHHHNNNIGSLKWGELDQNDLEHEELLMKKRLKSLSEHGDEKYLSCLIGNNNNMEYDNCKEIAEYSTCETNTTMIMESTPTVKTKEEDSTTCHAASENQDEENQTKEQTVRSHHTRSSRAAATHKQSERKRRDRINQKMKALQKLVPNACKTDKASMLDEVIEYMKQLKAQVNLMMSPRSVHDHQSMLMRMMMMMPSLGMHQQLQMSSILASMATSTTSPPPPPPPPHHHHHHNNHSFIPFIKPNIMMTFPEAPLVVAPPPVMQAWRANLAAAIANSLPQNEYYNRLFAQQSMNMELYNNMRALCTQQEGERSQKASRN